MFSGFTKWLRRGREAEQTPATPYRAPYTRPSSYFSDAKNSYGSSEHLSRVSDASSDGDSLGCPSLIAEPIGHLVIRTQSDPMSIRHSDEKERQHRPSSSDSEDSNDSLRFSCSDAEPVGNNPVFNMELQGWTDLGDAKEIPRPPRIPRNLIPWPACWLDDYSSDDSLVQPSAEIPYPIIAMPTVALPQEQATTAESENESENQAQADQETGRAALRIAVPQ